MWKKIHQSPGFIQCTTEWQLRTVKNRALGHSPSYVHKLETNMIPRLEGPEDSPNPGNVMEWKWHRKWNWTLGFCSDSSTNKRGSWSDSWVPLERNKRRVTSQWEAWLQATLAFSCPVLILDPTWALAWRDKHFMTTQDFFRIHLFISKFPKVFWIFFFLVWLHRIFFLILLVYSWYRTHFKEKLKRQLGHYGPKEWFLY